MVDDFPQLVDEDRFLQGLGLVDLFSFVAVAEEGLDVVGG
jgi:hypothetical protein